MGGASSSVRASDSISRKLTFKSPDRASEEPLLRRSDLELQNPDLSIVQNEAAELANRFRMSSKALNFSYKSFLVTDDQAGNNLSVSEGPFTSPVRDFGIEEDHSGKESPMQYLGDAIDTVMILSAPVNLSEHLSPSFFHRSISHALPEEVTCLTGLRFGFAVGLVNGEIHIAEIPLFYPLPQREGAVTCLTSNSDSYEGSFLASGTSDGEVVVWHLDKARGDLVMRFKEGSGKGKQKKGNPVTILRIARDNSRAVALFADNTLVFLDLSTRESKNLGKAHDQRVFSLEISQDCKWFMTAVQGTAIKIWDLSSAELLHTLRTGEKNQTLPTLQPEELTVQLKGEISSIYVSDSSDIFVFSKFSGAVIILNGTRIEAIAPLQYRAGKKLQYIFASTEKQFSLYSGLTYVEQRTSDEVVWIKSVSRGEKAPYIMYKTHDRLGFDLPDYKVSFQVNGDLCETSELQNLFGVVIGKLLVIYKLEGLWNVHILAPGLLDATPTETGTVLLHTERDILKVSPGALGCVQAVQSISKSQSFLKFSPDGKFVVLNTSNVSTDLVNIATGVVEKSFPEENCTYAAISPKSEFLFTYSQEGVKIRTLYTDTLVISHPAESGEFIHSVIFSQGNNLVAMCTSKRTLIWDMRNQTLVIRYSQHSLRDGVFSFQKFYYLEYGSQMNMALFSIPARRRMLESKERTHKAAICKDDRFCVILRSSVLILDFPTLIQIAEIPQQIENFVMMCGDEAMITSGPSGHFIWNLVEGRMVASIPNLGSVLVTAMIPGTFYALASDQRGGFLAVNIKAYTEEYRGVQQPDANNVKLRGVDSIIDTIEAYSLLGDFITNGHYRPELAGVIISPFKINGLHIIAYVNLLDSLPAALKSHTPIIKSVFGSPVTVAIQRKTRRCLEAILRHIISLQVDNMTEFISAIQCISDDILDLIKSGSNNLMQLFEAIVTDHMQGSLLSQFISPKSKLPIVMYTDSLFINPGTFGTHHGTEGAVLVLISFHICVLKWNFEMGSNDSISLLRALATAKKTDILRTQLVGAIITHKWNTLWIVICAYTIMYFSLLALLVLKIFSTGTTHLLNQSFLILNVFFLVHEVFQARTLGLEYLKDIWNYIDLARGFTCIAWILMSLETVHISFFTWIVVTLCFIRGLTHFRAFSLTRFYVRMVLDVIKEASAFIILLFYTTFAFGMLYAVSSPELIKSPADAWVAAYEVNMGRFEVLTTTTLQWACFQFASLTNIIVMLNLLVSILGDAFEKVQSRTVEADIKEMIDTILEYESLMVWKRGSGRKQYIQNCTEGFQEEEEVGWKGRAASIKKKVARVAKELKAEIKTSAEDMKKEMQQQMKQLEDSLMRKLQEGREPPMKRETLSSRLQAMEGQIRSWITPTFVAKDEE